MLVLGIETSCDETAAAVVERLDGRYRILSSVVTSQIDLHARFGGVVPEIASRAHLELLPAAVSQALEGAGLDGSRARRRGRHRRSRPHRRAARRRLRAPRRWPSAGTAPSSASTTSRPTSSPPGSSRPRGGPARAAPRGAARLGRPHDAHRHGRAGPLPAARPDPRRRRRRGVRQGRPLPRPGLPGWAGGRPPGRARAIRPPSPSPGRCRARAHELDFSFSGLKTSVVQPRAPPSRGRRRRRLRQLPGGRGRRAGGEGPPGRRPRRRPRPVPGRRGGRQQPAAPALARGVRRRRPRPPTCRARPSAPTTRP